MEAARKTPRMEAGRAIVLTPMVREAQKPVDALPHFARTSVNLPAILDQTLPLKLQIPKEKERLFPSSEPLRSVPQR